MAKKRRKCIHCRRRAASRPRLLCGPCYHNMRIRNKYPTLGKYTQDTNAQSQYARRPTDAIPGSEAKIRIMMDRVDNGLSAFHPFDSTFLE